MDVMLMRREQVRYRVMVRIEEDAALLREAYPSQPYGTVFGFLRTFVVAHKP